MADILIVYYSRAGENHYDGGLKILEKGNTQIVAECIREAVGGDLFRVDTVQPYAASYRECCGEAVAQWKGNARPEIQAFAENMDRYDTIFLGYPIWCGTYPMCMYTFLEHYDLTGKKILPFCTHEGSGFGRSIEELGKTCPGALIGEGIEIRGCKVQDNLDRIREWAEKNA